MKDKKLSGANAHFCALVAKGDRAIVDCLKEAYPKYKGKSENTVKSQAKRLVTKPEIMMEIARIKEETAAKVEGKYAGLKEEMIDRVVKGVRTGTDAEPLTVVEFSKGLDWLAKVLGWYAPTDVTVRNGGVAADYRPPTLMTMNDAEISEKLATLRGDAK